jgi:hypothetical protein
MASRIPFWRRLLLALVVAASGCMPAGPGGSTPSPTPSVAQSAAAEFDAAVVDLAIARLAQAGVTVRRLPSDPPLVAVAAPSRVALLRFQARNLALEAHAGGGTLGAELDAYAGAVGSPPLSPLLLGWLLVGVTDGARAAAALMPGATPGSDPAALVYPGLVMMLFLADIAGPAPTGGVLDGRPLAMAHVGPPAIAAAAPIAEGDLCGQLSDYLVAVLAGVIEPELEGLPAWLSAAAAQVARVETDPDRLRSAIAALALLAYATSISRTWGASLSAVPTEAHYIVGGDELSSPSKSFNLIVVVGDEAIADEVAECELLADAGLDGGGESEGVPVGWVTTTLQVHADEVEGDLELEERGQIASAVLEYQTRPETADAHANGAAASAVATVTAIVQRQEIDQVEVAVAGLLGGGGAAGAIVAAEYARVQPVLRELLFPRASASVSVSWHNQPGTPEPTADKTEFCNRYVALLRWWGEHMDTDYELTREWALEIVSQAVDMRQFAPADLLEHVDLIIRVYDTYATAPEPFNVPLVGPDAAHLVAAAVAMDAYCEIVRGEPPFEDLR